MLPSAKLNYPEHFHFTALLHAKIVVKTLTLSLWGKGSIVWKNGGKRIGVICQKLTDLFVRLVHGPLSGELLDFLGAYERYYKFRERYYVKTTTNHIQPFI